MKRAKEKSGLRILFAEETALVLAPGKGHVAPIPGALVPSVRKIVRPIPKRKLRCSTCGAERRFPSAQVVVLACGCHIVCLGCPPYFYSDRKG